MNNPTPPWRIVLIEDQTLFRNTLAKAIRLDDQFSQFQLLGEAADGLEAKDLCLRLTPDLIVTEIDLPRLDGIELARLLFKHLPRLRVLVLSRLKDPFTLNRLCEAGIHGYLAKEEPLEFLAEAMSEVASGRTYFTAAVRQTQARLRSDPHAFPKILSCREQAILCSVAAGLTSRSIAGRLNLSPRSVETYRYRMMRKLAIANAAGLIDYAFRNGFSKPENASEFISRRTMVGNPEGIVSSSPGLRGTSYPGSTSANRATPTGVAADLVVAQPQPR
jgi:DNA-binding NarL/FixJ family response regulator